MGRRAAHGLTRLPENFFEWSRAFGDDLGYEATLDGRPVSYPPGSDAKIATIVERLSRGQRLWHQGDKVDDALDREFDTESYRIGGDMEFGCVVGSDRAGRRHRYAIWTELAASGPRLLYIPATAGFRDSFKDDIELKRIKRHAVRHKARLVVVCPLFSARVLGASRLREVQHPVTSIGLLWIRWIARYVDKVVVCWGESPRLDRHVDVLWMLSRTTQGRHVYSAGLTEGGWPQPIGIKQGMERFDCGPWVAEKEEEEVEPELPAECVSADSEIEE